MTRVIIHPPFDKDVVQIIVCNDEAVYNWHTKSYMPREMGAEICTQCILEIPTVIYSYLEDQIKNGDSANPLPKDFIKGKLEATEKHLEDMRKLVFKNES